MEFCAVVSAPMLAGVLGRHDGQMGHRHMRGGLGGHGPVIPDFGCMPLQRFPRACERGRGQLRCFRLARGNGRSLGVNRKSS